MIRTYSPSFALFKIGIVKIIIFLEKKEANEKLEDGVVFMPII